MPLSSKHCRLIYSTSCEGTETQNQTGATLIQTQPPHLLHFLRGNRDTEPDRCHSHLNTAALSTPLPARNRDTDPDRCHSHLNTAALSTPLPGREQRHGTRPVPLSSKHCRLIYSTSCEETETRNQTGATLI